MGAFRVPLAVGDPQGSRFATVQALADTGSSFTWVPRSVLQALDVPPLARWEFEIAGGQIIEREVAETWVGIDGEQCVTVVVFGDEGSAPVLGAYTLERLRLAVDPVNRRLLRVRSLALSRPRPSAEGHAGSWHSLHRVPPQAGYRVPQPAASAPPRRGVGAPVRPGRRRRTTSSPARTSKRPSR